MLFMHLLFLSKYSLVVAFCLPFLSRDYHNFILIIVGMLLFSFVAHLFILGYAHLNLVAFDEGIVEHVDAFDGLILTPK